MKAFKTLGPMLVAVLAIVAVASPVAQASMQPTFTTDTNNKITDITQVSAATNRFIAFGEEITCNWAYFTDLTDIGNGTSTFEMRPLLKECHTKGGLFVTFNAMNCNFLIHLDTDGKLVEHVYTGTLDIVCPKAEEAILFTLYNDKAETFNLCTIKVGAQKGIEPVTATVDTGTPSSTDYITLYGTLQKIAISKSGLCGIQNGVAEYVMNLTMQGTDGFGNRRGMRICDVKE